MLRAGDDRGPATGPARTAPVLSGCGPPAFRQVRGRARFGAVWGDLGPGPAGVWFATSHTRCGVLVGPRGARRGFLPGAEGIDLVGGRSLWALSESATRPYQQQGGRPVVPMLGRFDVRGGINDWARPACRP